MQGLAAKISAEPVTGAMANQGTLFGKRQDTLPTLLFDAETAPGPPGVRGSVDGVPGREQGAQEGKHERAAHQQRLVQTL